MPRHGAWLRPVNAAFEPFMVDFGNIGRGARDTLVRPGSGGGASDD
jgi:hypothetical protein